MIRVLPASHSLRWPDLPVSNGPCVAGTVFLPYSFIWKTVARKPASELLRTSNAWRTDSNIVIDVEATGFLREGVDRNV